MRFDAGVEDGHGGPGRWIIEAAESDGDGFFEGVR